MTEELIF